MATKVLAPAKLNLVLKVLAKRPDGYHELFTIFQKVTLFDELILALTPEKEIILETQGEVPTGEDNLCVRAAKLYQARTNKIFGLKIRLTKKIPMAAGLGGGSSDAAAVLKFLNQHFGALSQEELMALGRRLGADVPFFLSPYSTALGRGIGEILSPWPTFPAWYVVVCPEVQISTAWAYQNLRLTTPCELPNYEPDQPLWHQGLVNDFEPLIFAAYPEIGRWKRRLKELGAKEALLSGSGASVFGVFEALEEAKKAYLNLKDEGVKIFLVTNHIPAKGGE